MRAPAIGGVAIVLAAAFVWRFSPEPRVRPTKAAAPAPAVAEPLLPAAEPPQVTEAPQVAEVIAPAAVDGDSGENAPQAPFERSPLPGETPRTPMAEFVAERQNIVMRSGAGAQNRALPENIAAVELEFAAEPIDRAWATGAEAAIYAGLAQISGLSLIDQRVECRSTMCRIELTQPTSARDGGRVPFNLLRDSVGLKPRWMMMGVGASPVMRSVGYFYREGFDPTENPLRE